MNTEIIAVGTELLLGDIVNTNAQYLSKQLAALGFNVYRQTVVGDNAARLTDAYREAFARVDLVVVCGGLGPTDDDLTKETAAAFFGKPLVLDAASLAAIERIFAGHNAEMTPNNRKQAYIPEGAAVLPNAQGTAPGVLLESAGKTLILLPGPPYEMEAMFEAQVVPFLRTKQDGVLVSHVLRTTGIGESLLVSKIADLLDRQTNPTIAPYADAGGAFLRITARAADEQAAHRLITPIADALRKRLADYVYAEDAKTSIATAVVRRLAERGLTLACAESCTGGLLSAMLVNVPGVSVVFSEGIVTYSNDAKIRRLGVNPETLRRFGAVSPQTAAEMAVGIAEAANADLGVAITGVAGPGGGTPEKPVGLVHIAVAFEGRVTPVELRVAGDRTKIRRRAAMAALDALWRMVV